MPAVAIDTIAHNIQLAVAPAFLLTVKGSSNGGANDCAVPRKPGRRSSSLSRKPDATADNEQQRQLGDHINVRRR